MAFNVKTQDTQLIDRVRASLRPYPQIFYYYESGWLHVDPSDDQGFKVSITGEDYRWQVYCGGWRKEFKSFEEAIRCFIFALSSRARLRVVSRGNRKYKWGLQGKFRDHWKEHSVTRHLLFPFWYRKKTVYLQNHWIDED